MAEDRDDDSDGRTDDGGRYAPPPLQPARLHPPCSHERCVSRRQTDLEAAVAVQKRRARLAGFLSLGVEEEGRGGRLAGA